MTLFEVVLALSVLTFGTLAMTSSSLVSHKLRAANRERSLAVGALRSVVEELNAVSQRSVDDELGWAPRLEDELSAGGSVGTTFTVAGLDTRDGDLTCGTVELIVDETRTDVDLGLDLGMPRDLDNDGAVDNPDVSASAILLPVIVRVRWTGQAGNREVAKGIYLTPY